MKSRPMWALVGTDYEFKPQRSLHRYRWAFYGLESQALDYVDVDGDKLWFMLRWSSPDVNWVTCEALVRFDAAWSGRFTDLCRDYRAKFVVDWNHGILKPSIVFSNELAAIAEVPLAVEQRRLQ